MSIYLSRDKSGNVSESEYYDYFDKDWYKIGMDKGKTTFTQPYRDGNNIVTTYVMPLKYNDTILGIIAADIYVNNISDILAEDPKNGSDDFTSLTSGKGVVVAHSIDSSFIMKDLSSDASIKSYIDMAQSLQESEAEHLSLTTGKDSVFIYIPVNTEGTPENWVFQSVVSKSKMTETAVKGAVSSIVINVIVIVGIAFVIFILLRKKVSLLLAVVSRTLAKLADYNLNLDAEIEENTKYDKSGDEIASLILLVRKLHQNLSSIVTAINAHAQNTATTAEELDKVTNTINSCKNDGNAILKKLVKLTDENNKISGQVSHVIAETSEAAEEISASTQEQALTFEEVKDESKVLMELSGELEEVIQKFKP